MAQRIAITGEYSFTPEQLERVRGEGIEVRGLMARRSPEPEPGILYTLRWGALIVSTVHRRGELMVIVPPPVYGERIAYRPDRVGG